MKKMYRITVGKHVVEGKATSTNNACRLAFRKLIEAKLITNTPPTDINSESTFKDTKVEVIDEPLSDP